ncbi:MAG: type II toxin-antitoxin system PemK/MazF family toxin [Faecalibacillus faecis]
MYVADLNPYQGSEQGGIRPVVILQNDAGNYFSSTTIVSSLTSHVGKENLPTHVFINSRDVLNMILIMCKQIRTIDKSRLIRCLGRLDEYEMEEVEEALSVRLGCFDDSLSINVDNPIYFENIRFFFLHVENRTCHWH